MSSFLDFRSSASQSFEWSVSNPVQVVNPGQLLGAQGEPALLQIQAGAAPTYGADGLPDGLRVDGTTGQVSGTISLTAVDRYFVSLTAANTSGSSNSRSFLWLVSSPIAVTDPGVQAVSEGGAVSLPLQACDANAAGGALTWGATNLPPGLSVDPRTGAISGTIAAGAYVAGPYLTTVTVVDALGYGGSLSILWEIADPVALTDPGSQSNTEGDTVSIQFQAADVNAGNSGFTWDASGLPTGLSLDPSSGAVHGVIAAGAAGSFETAVTATDATGATASQTFGWNVAAAGSGDAAGGAGAADPASLGSTTPPPGGLPSGGAALAGGSAGAAQGAAADASIPDLPSYIVQHPYHDVAGSIGLYYKAGWLSSEVKIGVYVPAYQLVGNEGLYLSLDKVKAAASTGYVTTAAEWAEFFEFNYTNAFPGVAANFDIWLFWDNVNKFMAAQGVDAGVARNFFLNDEHGIFIRTASNMLNHSSWSTYIHVTTEAVMYLDPTLDELKAAQAFVYEINTHIWLHGAWLQKDLIQDPIGTNANWVKWVVPQAAGWVKFGASVVGSFYSIFLSGSNWAITFADVVNKDVNVFDLIQFLHVLPMGKATKFLFYSEAGQAICDFGASLFKSGKGLGTLATDMEQIVAANRGVAGLAVVEGEKMTCEEARSALQTIAEGNGKNAALAAEALAQFGDEMQWCFTRDTPVATVDGLKPIGEIEAGERVRTFDFTTGRWELAEVLQRFDSTYVGPVVTIRVGDAAIRSTINHPYWVVEGDDLRGRPAPEGLGVHEDEGLSLPGRWVNSQDLRAGDMLYTREGRCRRVDAVDVRESSEEHVCNLAVQGRHYYAVGECAVLVHNQSWCDVLANKVGKKPQALLNLVKKEGLSASVVHGHHIVMQTVPSNWNAAAQQFVRDAKALLTEYHIPLLATKAEATGAEDISNLCYAINGRDGIHSQAYAEAVWTWLDRVSTAALRRSGPAAATAAVQKALSQMAEIMQDGRTFW